MELNKEINKRLTKVTFILEENKLTKPQKMKHFKGMCTA